MKPTKIVLDWANNISLRNPKIQTRFYAKDAILLATYSPILIGQKEIYKYFIEFLNKKDLNCIITSNVNRIYKDLITSSGFYTFTFKDDNNNVKTVKARYTFVIYKDKIIDHHSSEEPNVD